MSDSTYPTSVRTYTRVMQVLDSVFDFVWKTLLSLLPIALGALAFYIVSVQYDQTSVPGGDSNWAAMFVLLFIFSVFGGFASISISREEGWVAWSITNLVVAGVMWIILGLTLLLCGLRSIPVSDGQFMVSSGHLYQVGTRAPRGYLKVRSLPFPASISTTYRITKSDALDNGSTPVVRNIDIELSLAPRLGPALDARLQKTSQTGMFWGTNPEHYFENATEQLRSTKSLPIAGQEYAAPAAWLSTVRVVSVNQSVALATDTAR